MCYKIVSLSVQEPLEKLPCYLYFGFSGMVDAHTNSCKPSEANRDANDLNPISQYSQSLG